MNGTGAGRYRKILAPLAVAAAAFFVFLPSLHNGFVNWDDLQNFLENDHYRGLGWAQIKWAFTTFHLNHYQPLSWLSYGLDYKLWGMAPYGYHLTSAAIHALGAVSVYFLCRVLLRAANGTGDERADLLPAVFAALLFALHPLRVESVAWATERRDVLCALFYTAALALYAAPRAPGTAPGSFARRHLLPLAAFLAALLSKSMAVTLPAALLLLDIYPLRRLPAAPRRWAAAEHRDAWLEKLPYFALAAIFAAIAYFWSGRDSTALSYHYADFEPSAAKALYAGLFYPLKTLLPINLSPIYLLPAWAKTAPALLAEAAGLTCLTWGALRAGRRWPAVPSAWAFYLIAAAPVSGLINGGPQAAADRYSYIPCIGFALLAGAAARMLLADENRAKRHAAAAALLAVPLCLALLTWRQQAVWKDSGTLWSRAIAMDPGCYLAHGNLGSWLSSNGRRKEAEEHFREALRIRPDYAGAHYNLARELAEQGDLNGAEEHYKLTLELGPTFGIAAYNLGLLLEHSGRLPEAEHYYAEAFRIDPGFAEAHYNLSNLLAARGDLARALDELGRALKISPDYADAHANLCALLAMTGRPAEGLEHCLRAIELAPAHRNARYNAALALTALGRPAEAARQYREALAIDPSFMAARGNLEALERPLK